MWKKLGIAAVVATAAQLTWAAIAPGGATPRGVWDLDVVTKRAGAPTGLRFQVGYRNPADPEGKPSPVTGAVFHLPPGLRIHNRAVPRCSASDADFRAQGRAACPAATRVGTGTLVAMTGFPGVDPLTADIVAFNGVGELVEVVFVEGTNTVAGMDRLTIGPGRLTAHPPTTPGGPPDGRTAVRDVRLRIPRRIGPGGRAYVTTPRRCLTGRWRSRAHYEFADGGETTVRDRTLCRRTSR